MNFQKLLLQSLTWRGVYFISMLLVNVFLSRYLQAASTGIVYYISNIFSFSLIIVGLSFESGVTFYASGALIQKNKLIWFVVLWSFVLVALVLAAIALYFHFSSGAHEVLDNRYYYFGVTYIAGLFLTNCAAALFYTQNNFLLPNALLAAWNILLIIFIPKHPAASIEEATPILDAYFLVFILQGISICVAYLFSDKATRQFALPVKAELKDLFRFSSLAMAANIVFFLVYRVDYLFVNASPVCTAADLGNYIQVSKLGQLLLIIPQIIASVIFPRTASGIERKELNNTLMIMARLFLQLYVVVLIVVIFAGQYVFTLLFGETFNAMKLPFIILIPGIFSLSVLTLLAAYFSGKGKVIVNVTGTGIALVVVIIGDYLFVPRYGIVAAAAVSTVGYTVNLLYILYVFYKDYSINLYDFFHWRKEDYTWIKNLLLKGK
ncbi:MAG TPA: polysaccharide biosynthesis C-terminal domain-containing protein [Panacibacter sp.]|nr:polysaccharide biosynthesis C-terminal domain-containing protein [Panacibacter sp.]HNP43406.1 polysaccharide biosynthesis C-terminal domain-containing protein [Panacibacter sp.]